MEPDLESVLAACARLDEKRVAAAEAHNISATSGERTSTAAAELQPPDRWIQVVRAAAQTLKVLDYIVPTVCVLVWMLTVPA